MEQSEPGGDGQAIVQRSSQQAGAADPTGEDFSLNDRGEKCLDLT